MGKGGRADNLNAIAGIAVDQAIGIVNVDGASDISRFNPVDKAGYDAVVVVNVNESADVQKLEPGLSNARNRA